MKNLFKNIAVILLVFASFLAIFAFWQGNQAEDNSIAINELVEKINNNEVKTIEIDGSVVNITLADDSKKEMHKEPGESFSELMTNYGVDAEILSSIPVEVKKDSSGSIWMITLLQIGLPLLFLSLIHI